MPTNKPSVIVTNPDGTRTPQASVVATMDKQQFHAPDQSIAPGTLKNDPEQYGTSLQTFLKTLTQQLEKFEQSVRKAIDPVLRSPTLRATYIKDVQFTSGSTLTLQHKLGRKYMGWRVCRPRVATPNLFEVPNDTGDSVNSARLDAVQITLSPGATFTADIEVF